MSRLNRSVLIKVENITLYIQKRCLSDRVFRKKEKKKKSLSTFAGNEIL